RRAAGSRRATAGADPGARHLGQLRRPAAHPGRLPGPAAAPLRPRPRGGRRGPPGAAGGGRRRRRPGAAPHARRLLRRGGGGRPGARAGLACAVPGGTGGGVDVVVDPVGSDRFLDSLRLLRPEGRLVVVGFAGGTIPEVKVNRLLLRNISVLGAAWREFL